MKVMRVEAKFAKELGTDPISGLTLDGAQLDLKRGHPLPEKTHKFTAPSKESIHVAILA